MIPDHWILRDTLVPYGEEGDGEPAREGGGP
jgi:hypothetical protein